jgi:alpha-tubulin suppressor-like RCC1 family protein
VGRVWCWGRWGDVTTDRPLPISGLTGVQAISAGGGHACALRADGSVACWGANESGQLGDGSTQTAAAPTAVSGLGHAAQISAGGAHSCAISDGAVLCWGSNTSRQLGDGLPAEVTRPRPVTLGCR